jgi:hypothetical protein
VADFSLCFRVIQAVKTHSRILHKVKIPEHEAAASGGEGYAAIPTIPADISPPMMPIPRPAVAAL